MKINIFGATGLVGNCLLNECLQNEKITEITIFVRKNIDLEHAKLRQIIANFENLTEVKHEITGDIVFNCLGTTMKQAGSQAAQYAVDCKYPALVAEFAAANGVACMINVSSVGASASGNFYLNTKHDMEIKTAGFIGKKTYSLRPSLLVGERKQSRFWERVSTYAFYGIDLVLLGSLKKYHSINAEDVAKAMLNIAFTQPDSPQMLEYEEIMRFSKLK